MPVEFSSFPADWRLPLYWIEVDPSMAGFPVYRQAALLVGQMIATGAGAGAQPATPDVPVPISSTAQANALFGPGSQLASMARAFFKNNSVQLCYAGPVLEPASGAAAAGSITIATAPTQAGTLSVYVAGHKIDVGVGATDTVATVATNLVAAMGLIPTLPVTAVVDGTTPSKVNLTCKWKGSTGNDIDLRDNYAGTLGGEQMPIGLTLTYSGAKLAGGTGVPDFTNLIAALGDERYEYVSLAVTDSTSLNAWETEYGFGDSGRWGWMRQLYGHLFAAARGTLATQLTFGASRNSPITSVMAVEPNSPSPVWEWAAAYTAKAARALTDDPARPLQTLTLDGIMPAPKHERYLLGELNNIAGTGMATQQTDAATIVHISRETTTYQTNLYGEPDDAYTDVTTLATLARLFRNQKQAITSKYPRHKLADNGTRFGPGQAIVTPNIIKAELVAEYAVDEFNGLVENVNAYKAALIVERDPNNVNRVNVLYPPDLVNQLRIFAVLAQFRLQYDRGLESANTVF